MRVTTWNCHRGKGIDNCRDALRGLGADLIALQEPREPKIGDPSVIWHGGDPLQGSAVVSASPAFPIERVDIPDLHHTVVPVVVMAPEPFMFVSVWTHRCPTYDAVAWKAVKACKAAADDRSVPIVAAGDFNVRLSQKSPPIGDNGGGGYTV